MEYFFWTTYPTSKLVVAQKRCDRRLGRRITRLKWRWAGHLVEWEIDVVDYNRRKWFGMVANDEIHRSRRQ